MIYILISVSFLLAMLWLLLTNPSWVNQLLYNGDSVVLPLMIKSLIAGEKLDWTFSTQFFLFPEFLLYSLCYLIAGTYKSSIILNSYLNLTLLFLIIYKIFCIFFEKIILCYKAVALFVLLIALAVNAGEAPNMNSTSLTELVLFNSYYYGALIISLVSLMIMLKFYNGDFRNAFFPASVLFVLTALTFFSDPLFLLYFVAPWFCIFACSILIGRPVRKGSVTLNLAMFLGIIIGFFLRRIPSNNLSLSYSSYFKPQNFLTTSDYLISTYLQSIQKFPSSIIVIIATIGFISLLVSVIVILAKRNLFYHVVNDKYFFLPMYLLFSISMVVLIQVFCGMAYTRYLIILPVYIYLWISFILTSKTNKILFYSMYLILILAIAATLFNYRNNFSVNALETNDSLLTCVENNKDILNIDNAVGGFWTTRSLDLYSKTSTRFLQVGKDFRPFHWMNNSAPYKMHTFNTVLVDIENGPNNINKTDVLTLLGEPTYSKECNDTQLYVYDEKSPGHKILNARIKD